MPENAPVMHFALRASEPNRAACGKSAVSRIYVGAADQDGSNRRQSGQAVTTCAMCRRAMLWNAPTHRPGSAPRDGPIGGRLIGYAATL